MPDSQPLPTEDALRREKVAQIRAAIDTLPPKHQQVVCLRFYEEASLAEIASALGLSLGTVKSRLHHALKKLRQMPSLLNLFNSRRIHECEMAMKQMPSLRRGSGAAGRSCTRGGGAARRASASRSCRLSGPVRGAKILVGNCQHLSTDLLEIMPSAASRSVDETTRLPRSASISQGEAGQTWTGSPASALLGGRWP